MSQRDSGYARKEGDLYETPEWVTEALLPHIAEINSIWEPACASGKMVRVLSRADRRVEASDPAIRARSWNMPGRPRVDKTEIVGRQRWLWESGLPQVEVKFPDLPKHSTGMTDLFAEISATSTDCPT